MPHVQGMYKSKLECPKCSHVGVKFDPYMYLSLNLPESKRRTLQVTALYVDGSQPPLQHAVDVPKTGDLLPYAEYSLRAFSFRSVSRLLIDRCCLTCLQLCRLV